jgi:hypothetical protein
VGGLFFLAAHALGPAAGVQRVGAPRKIYPEKKLAYGPDAAMLPIPFGMFPKEKRPLNPSSCEGGRPQQQLIQSRLPRDGSPPQGLANFQQKEKCDQYRH